MGGRMTSQAVAQHPLEPVRGLVFLGFPLHPPNQPGTKRAEHLAKVTIPMLFLQGTRDALADTQLISSVTKRLGERASLHVIPDADHSFHVPARTGRTDAEAMSDMLDVLAVWIRSIISRQP